MNEQRPSSSSLREPLLDPEVVANSEYIVSCSSPPLRNRSISDSSTGLEDMLRSWWHNQSLQQQNDDDDDDGLECDNTNGDIIMSSRQHRSLPQVEDDENDESGIIHRSERPCRPWYKHPLQIMAMISNFSTSFNVVNISLVLQIFKIIFEDVHPVNAEDESMLASSLLGGMVLGQIIGGALGDSFLGLAGALALVMIVQIVASLGSASVPVHAHDFYWTLAAWRFVLGIGAGAVYPLAACLSVEQGNPSSCIDHEALRTKRVVWTFAMQGVGFWVVPALAAMLVFCRMKLDLVWRVLLGAGCLPGLVLLYLQYRVLFDEPTTTNPIEEADAQATQQAQVQQGSLQGEADDHVPVTDVPEQIKGDNDAAPENTSDALVPSSDERIEADAENPAPPRIYSASAPNLPALGSQDSPLTHSCRSEQDRQREQDNTGMTDRELHDDSDGEVGTFLDSSPDMDMSSAGVFRESEPPVISTGWWVSLQTEERLGRKLLGTAVTWFLFDVLFYGNTLFQPFVIEQAFGSRNNLPAEAFMRRVVMDSLILNSVSLPGYFVAALLIGKTTLGIKQTPRYVMMQGFTGMALLYFAIAFSWKPLKHYPSLLVFLYGLTFFFANYGPNTTTFILPSLVYSAECRSTFNGLSAAFGKLGALVGASVFGPLDNKYHEEFVMAMCAVIALVALIMTALFVRLKPTPTAHPAPGRGRFSIVTDLNMDAIFA